MSRRRAIALVIVHVLIIAHVVHWWVAGRTLAPLEPSEAMYTLNNGYVNAGFFFFVAALAATLLLGRFVCGWGCHVIAYQDLSAWMLKKIGIKPKPLRSRLLVLAPFALAVYMFVWPSAYRWWSGMEAPALTNHMMKSNFWETFPGPVIAVLTLLVCGFVAVYFLGSKGFCTYACPYGGFFRALDHVAVGRIRVTDACRHCGHCTATCTSNVRVHEEVARFGMVVDPGCMKCMDCISVCPNDALYFGLGRPALATAAPATPRPRRYDFSLGEEGVAAIVGLVALLSFRGLYDQIPLLLAMAIAGVAGFLAVKTIRLATAPNVRLQKSQLKKGGRVTGVGRVFACAVAVFAALTAHSALVQYNVRQGMRLYHESRIPDEVWQCNNHWFDQVSDETRANINAAIAHLTRADRWGWATTPSAMEPLVWLRLARGEDDQAERIVRRLIRSSPHRADPYRGLAGIMRKTERYDDAETYYRESLAVDPTFAPARKELCAMLVERGRSDGAIRLYREAIDTDPDEPQWRTSLARLLLDLHRPAEAKRAVVPTGGNAPDSAPAYRLYGLACLQLGQVDEGIDALGQAVAMDPRSAEAHYNLGMALLTRRQIDRAIDHLQTAVEIEPQLVLAQYNLAVGLFMAGRPADALPHIHEAIRLNPNDPDAYGFLAEVLRALGDADGARAASQHAEQRRTHP